MHALDVPVTWLVDDSPSVLRARMVGPLTARLFDAHFDSGAAAGLGTSYVGQVYNLSAMVAAVQAQHRRGRSRPERVA